MNAFLLQSKRLTAFTDIPELPEAFMLYAFYFFSPLPAHFLPYKLEPVFLCKRNSHSKMAFNLENASSIYNTSTNPSSVKTTDNTIGLFRGFLCYFLYFYIY